MHSSLQIVSVRRPATPFQRKGSLPRLYIQAEGQNFNNEPYEKDTIQLLTIAREGAPSFAPKPGLPEFAFRSMFFTNWAFLALGVWAALTMLQMKDPNGSNIISYERSPVAYIIFWCGFLLGAYKVFRYKNALFGKFRPQLHLLGTNVPSVDIVICCCNEKLSIIRNTILATLELDYPANRFRVLVSDDGGSAELAEQVRKLAIDHSNLYYTARKKEGPANYKAGNLNHASSILDNLPSGPAEMLAGLDADMIPEKRWLRAVVPHLLVDPKLGLANPPQAFYNTPLNDSLAQSLVSPVYNGDIVNDMAGTAVCNGSGWVMRRECLDEVGGFPYGSMTEDIYLSRLLLRAGWKTAYIPEPLQYGLIPETFYGHVRQFTRWNVGFAQIGMQLHFCWNPWRSGQLSLSQRYMISIDHSDPFLPLLWATTTIIFIFCLAFRPEYSLQLPGKILHSSAQTQQLLLIGILALVLDIVSTLQKAAFVGWVATLASTGNDIWMAPYYAYYLLKLLPLWQLFGKGITFTPTGSIQPKVNERNARSRAPLLQRLKAVFWDSSAIVHVVLILFSLVGILRSYLLASNNCKLAEKGVCRDMLYVKMLSIPVIQIVIAYLIPVLYAVSPVTVDDQYELLQPEKSIDEHHNFRKEFVPHYPTKLGREYRWNLFRDVYSYLYFMSRFYILWVLRKSYRP